jgi:hypothetical protein
VTSAAGSQTLTLTAAVTAAGSDAVNEGQVQFSVDGQTASAYVQAGSATALVNLPNGIAPGQYAIAALYTDGMGADFRGGSGSGVLTVLAPPAPRPLPTTTVVTASVNPWLAGESLTLTALVNPTAGSGTPTGNVLFLDGSTVLGTAALDGGVATFTTTALTAGSHVLSAAYGGDANYSTSTTTDLAEIITNPAPLVSSLAVASVAEGSAGFTLAINGSDFVSGATVTYNGSPLTVSVASSTQVQVVVPPALLVDEGMARITITNPGPGGGASLPQTFTISDAPLTAHVSTLSVAGNKQFSGVVTTFSDGDPMASAADFTAIITWDNGTASLGTIAGSTGTFTVSGTHKFGAFSNAHTVTVAIYDKGGSTVTVTDSVIDPGKPAALTVVAGAGQTATVGQAYAPLQARVTDSHGNPVAGIGVTFRAPTRGASGSWDGRATAVVVTDTNGLATAPTFTADTRAGAFVVTASIRGIRSARFDLTNTAAAVAQITALAGTPQSAKVGATFSTVLDVRVTDSYGNPVAGVAVTFTVSSGSGASGTFAGDFTTGMVETNEFGLATATSVRAIGRRGRFTVTADVVGLPDAAVFDLSIDTGRNWAGQ